MGTTGIPAFDAYYDAGLTALVTGGNVVPAWSPDGSILAYVEGPADDRRGWRVDVATGARSELADVTALRAAIGALTGQPRPVADCRSRSSGSCPAGWSRSGPATPR